MAKRSTTTYGFARTSQLLQGRIRKASESRGFAQSRILTHWDEVAGASIAAIARPVDVSYSRGGFGATLTVLTTGPNAPLVEMQKEEIRTQINAVYGYNAIRRVRVTQTAPTGFADGQVDFVHRKPRPAETEPSPEVATKAREVAGGVADDGLRQALERLATNVISKENRGR